MSSNKSIPLSFDVSTLIAYNPFEVLDETVISEVLGVI